MITPDIKYHTVTMESDNHICVRCVTEQKHILIFDVENPDNFPYRLPSQADSVIMRKKSIAAVRGNKHLTPQNIPHQHLTPQKIYRTNI